MKTGLLVLLCLAALPAFAAEPIKIGAGLPTTGSLAAIGEQMRGGFQAAADAENAAGGVNGRQLEVLYEDDACDAKQGLAVANLFAMKKVSLASHLCSPTCMVARDVYKDQKILLMAAACSNDALTAEGDLLINRAYPAVADQAGVIAGHILAHEDWQTTAIVSDRDGVMMGLANGVNEALVAGGRTVLPMDVTNKGERDFSSLITRLKTHKPDVVYLSLWQDEVGLFARQARAAGLESMLIASDTALADVVSNIAGAAADGLRFVYAPDPQLRETAKKIVDDLKAKKLDTGGFALWTYAIVQAFAAAARDAQSDDPEKIAAMLRAKQFETVLGPVGFDAKGNLKGIMPVMYEWRHGKYAELPPGQ